MIGKQLLARWKSAQRWPFGRALFSLLLGRAVPYTGSIRPLVLELDDEPGIKESKLTQAGGKTGKLKLNGVRENSGVREKAYLGSCVCWINLPHDFELLDSFAALKGDGVHLALTAYLGLEPV